MQQVLAQLPTPDEIATIITKRQAQSTFEKVDFFQSGNKHIGSILRQIRDNLVTVPNVVMEEVEEEFKDNIMKVLTDEQINSLNRYCDSRQSKAFQEKKHVSNDSELVIPETQLRTSQRYTPNEAKVIQTQLQ